MGLLFRAIFREVAKSAIFGAALFTFVLFLQRVGKLFEILVRSSAPPATVAHLFVLAIPFTLSFTMPLGVLVRGSDRPEPDVERWRNHRHARGRSSQPQSDRARIVVRNPGDVGHRHRLALADTLRHLEDVQGSQSTGGGRADFGSAAAGLRRRISQSDSLHQRRDSGRGDSLAQRIYRRHHPGGGAEEDRSRSRRRAHRYRGGPRHRGPGCASQSDPAFLQDGATYDVGKDPTDYYTTSAPTGAQVLEATKPNEVHAKGYTEIDTIPLYRLAYHDKTLDHDNVIQARIELHQRLALPPACFLLALIGIPLGISSRKGGKSGAFVMTVALAFVYWMGLIAANGLAKQQKLPVGIAMWIPNAIFAVVGVFLLTRMERPGDRDLIGTVTGWVAAAWTSLRGKLPAAAAQVRSRSRGWRMFLIPQVVDRYVLKSFLFWFVLLLVGFVLMTHVYTFFDLLSDIVKNNIAMTRVFTYLFFLTPAAYFRLGAHERSGRGSDHFRHSHQAQRNHRHESQRRQPVSAGGAGAGRGAVDERRRCLRSRITMCRTPIASRTRFARRSKASRCKPICIRTGIGSSTPGSNNDPTVFYFKYIDGAQKLMLGPQVFELDAANFRIHKHISAEKARWEPTLRTWVFENGWSREDPGGRQRKIRIISRDRPPRLRNWTSGRIISCRRCCRISR